MQQHLLTELTAAVQAAEAATTPAQVGAAYLQLVGYDSHEDDPTATLDELGDMLLDYVREACHADGIHVADVGLDPLQRDGDRFGPGLPRTELPPQVPGRDPHLPSVPRTGPPRHAAPAPVLHRPPDLRTLTP